MRALSWGLPLGTVLVAIGVGIVFDVGSAFLVFVTGALLGSILLLWYSLRTLAGDVPADPALDAAIASHSPRTELDERKRRALRALKDLEQEHAIGKIDDADYKALLVEYRAQAKAVIREMDDVLAPYRAEAEALVTAHLAKRHIKSSHAEPAEAPEPAEEPADDAEDEEEDSSEADDGQGHAREAQAPDGRVTCPSCETANDSDAAFCKRCGAKLGEASEPDVESSEADA